MKLRFKRPPNFFFRVTGVVILLYEATLWPTPQGEIVLAAIGLLSTPEFLKRDSRSGSK